MDVQETIWNVIPFKVQVDMMVEYILNDAKTYHENAKRCGGVFVECYNIIWTKDENIRRMCENKEMMEEVKRKLEEKYNIYMERYARSIQIEYKSTKW